MPISSRTPEGRPARCPLCGADVVVEPSVIVGDATCPRCGGLLWFLGAADPPRIYPRTGDAPLRSRAIDAIAEQLGIRPEEVLNRPNLLAELGADSLDVVELVMELEEEF